MGGPMTPQKGPGVDPHPFAFTERHRQSRGPVGVGRPLPTGSECRARSPADWTALESEVSEVTSVVSLWTGVGRVPIDTPRVAYGCR